MHRPSRPRSSSAFRPTQRTNIEICGRFLPSAFTAIVRGKVIDDDVQTWNTIAIAGEQSQGPSHGNRVPFDASSAIVGDRVNLILVPFGRTCLSRDVAAPHPMEVVMSAAGDTRATNDPSRSRAVEGWTLGDGAVMNAWLLSTLHSPKMRVSTMDRIIRVSQVKLTRTSGECRGLVET